MSRAKRGRNRADLYLKSLGDRVVVALTVVAKKNRQPLTLRQTGDPSANAEFVAAPRDRGLRRDVVEVFARQLNRASVVAGCVHKDAPDPRSERPIGPKRPERAESSRECLLNRVDGAHLASRDCSRHTYKIGISVPVERLQRRARDRLLPAHCRLLTPTRPRGPDSCLVTWRRARFFSTDITMRGGILRTGLWATAEAGK